MRRSTIVEGGRHLIPSLCFGFLWRWRVIVVVRGRVGHIQWIRFRFSLAGVAVAFAVAVGVVVRVVCWDGGLWCLVEGGVWDWISLVSVGVGSGRVF